MQLWTQLEANLSARDANLRRRALKIVPAGALDLASNDYLGLSKHPEVIEAACDAARKFGAGATASRLVSGHFSLIEALEAELARFKNTAAALVFSSGYAANLGVISALSNESTALFCHKRNHASLVEACQIAQMSGTMLRFFDLNHKLRALLENSGSDRKIIVIDGVFSMDGDICDLPAILALAREFDALVLLDDAHGTGTLGATGRGTSEHFGHYDERIIQIGTLSKTLGSQGGFVAGPRVLIEWLVNEARPFIYSTGLNPAAVGAALKSLELIEREPGRIEKCRCNARRLAEMLREMGFEATNRPSPIVPLTVENENRALELSARLLERGLWCPAIRPPTVKTSRLRLAANASWNDDDWARVVAGFKSLKAA